MPQDVRNQLADNLIKAAETGDADLAMSLFSPDFVLWHNTTGLELGVNELTNVILQLKDFKPRYEQINRVLTDTGFVSQHVVVGTRSDGGSFRMPACIVATVRDDKIARINEWFDSASAPM